MQRNATLAKERMKAMRLKKGKLSLLGILTFAMDQNFH